MKANKKTVILSALAVEDCLLGGIIIHNNVTSKSHTKEAEVKTSANYIDESISNVGNDIIIILEAEKISKELGENIMERAKVPAVIVNNFLSKKEVEEKVLSYFETLK